MPVSRSYFLGLNRARPRAPGRAAHGGHADRGLPRRRVSRADRRSRSRVAARYRATCRGLLEPSERQGHFDRGAPHRGSQPARPRPPRGPRPRDDHHQRPRRAASIRRRAGPRRRPPAPAPPCRRTSTRSRSQASVCNQCIVSTRAPLSRGRGRWRQRPTGASHDPLPRGIRAARETGTRLFRVTLRVKVPDCDFRWPAGRRRDQPSSPLATSKHGSDSADQAARSTTRSTEIGHYPKSITKQVSSQYICEPPYGIEP